MSDRTALLLQQAAVALSDLLSELGKLAEDSDTAPHVGADASVERPAQRPSNS